MSAKNRAIGTADACDFYPTPAWATRLILPHLVPPTWTGTIIEPAAGDGAILDVVRAYAPGATLAGIEMNPGRAEAARAKGFDIRTGSAIDDARWTEGAPLVLTNPPFGIALDFARRAIREAGPDGTVAMLLRLAWLASAERYAFHVEHPSDVYVLSRRPYGDCAEYAWIVWGPGRGGRWTLLREAEQPSAQTVLDWRAA